MSTMQKGRSATKQLEGKAAANHYTHQIERLCPSWTRGRRVLNRVRLCVDSPSGLICTSPHRRSARTLRPFESISGTVHAGIGCGIFKSASSSCLSAVRASHLHGTAPISFTPAAFLFLSLIGGATPLFLGAFSSRFAVRVNLSVSAEPTGALSLTLLFHLRLSRLLRQAWPMLRVGGPGNHENSKGDQNRPGEATHLILLPCSLHWLPFVPHRRVLVKITPPALGRGASGIAGMIQGGRGPRK